MFLPNHHLLIALTFLHITTLHIPGISLCMHPANERWCYTVMLSLIGWVYSQNDADIALSFHKTSSENSKNTIITNITANKYEKDVWTISFINEPALNYERKEWYYIALHRDMKNSIHLRPSHVYFLINILGPYDALMHSSKDIKEIHYAP